MTDPDSDDLERMLQDPARFNEMVHEVAKTEAAERVRAQSREYRHELRELYDRLLAPPERFAPGDLVTWKPGLQNKTYPLPGSVGVVVEHLPEPFIDPDKESGSQYYREPLDLALGISAAARLAERQFVIYWFDSRRFMRAEQPDES